MNQKSAYHTKVLIIGSGPAGYSAAIYAARSSLSPILVSGQQPGGQLTITTEVENYPGFAESIQGPQLMRDMEEQSRRVGVRIVNDVITNVNLKGYPFIATGSNNNQYYAKSIIIATGAHAKWLGLKSEAKFMGFGVSGCATCDGFFYKKKTVFVIGGGNTAVEEALYLTNHASEVILLHRRNALKAEAILQDRLFKSPKISIIWDSVLEEIVGSEKPRSVKSITVKNLKTGVRESLKADGVFIAIGHSPNTYLFKNQLDIDDEGYIITKADSTKTSVAGVFAAGDVQDKIFRQAITAAGSGCMASLEALKFIETQ